MKRCNTPIVNITVWGRHTCPPVPLRQAARGGFFDHNTCTNLSIACNVGRRGQGAICRWSVRGLKAVTVTLHLSQMRAVDTDCFTAGGTLSTDTWR